MSMFPSHRVNNISLTFRARAFMALWLAASLGAPARALAQNPSLLNPSQPQLVYNAEGHTAPVLALHFTDDGRQLISGGLDQVVKVWDVGIDRPTLARTIRPPVWRAPRGAIHALALAPDPTDRDSRLMAVAGISPLNSPTSPILIYRAGGPGGQAWEPSRTLPTIRVDPGKGVEAPKAGVLGSINCLAFDAGGRYLASGGKDTTVVVWDVAKGTVYRNLKAVGDETFRVNKLAISPDGRFVWTGGTDGLLRLWDLQSPRADPTAYGWPLDPAGSAIQPSDAHRIVSLAVGADQRAVVVGREDGSLIRYDAATLANARRLIPFPEQGGPVDAISFDPVATHARLGLARLVRRTRDAEAPATQSVVEFRSADDGRRIGATASISSIVRACAFDPTGAVFAFAGGDTQAISLMAPDRPGPAPRESIGEGSSIRELGFAREGLVVGFRRRPDADPKTGVEAFDLRGRRKTTMSPEELAAGRLPTKVGPFELRPTKADTIQLSWSGRAGEGLPLTIDRNFVRWWSYGFLAARPGQYPPVAVGCQDVIIVFGPVTDAQNKLTGYRPTRHLRGHAGAILGLAASADGAWLASGGADQTIRLWDARGVGSIAKFGARLTPRGDGKVEVGEVDPDGFAHRAGLRDRDSVVWEAVDQRSFDLKTRDPSNPRDLSNPLAIRLDEVSPGKPLQFEIQRRGKPFETDTKKQDHPVLSLFVSDPDRHGGGADQAWILWNPDGFYDTSVTADRRFLGWHRNAKDAANSGADLNKPTSFVPIRTFETLLRNPKVIDGLLAGKARSEVLPKDANGAVVDVVKRIDEDAPPRIKLAAPAVQGATAVRVAASPMKVRFEEVVGANEGARMRGWRVLVGTKQVASGRQGEGEAVAVDAEVPLDLPGNHTVTVIASNEGGLEQRASLEVEYSPPVPPAAKEHQMIVAALGVDSFAASDLPGIAEAAKDAKDFVDGFLSSRSKIQTYHARYPAGDKPWSPLRLHGGDASRAEFEEVLDALRFRGRAMAKVPKTWSKVNPADLRGLDQGDTLVLMIASHVLDAVARDDPARPPWPRPVLALADSARSQPDSMVDATRIVEALGEVAKTGCRVIVFLDGYHETTLGRGGVAEMAHALDDIGAIVVMPSQDVPNGADKDGPGNSAFFAALFALADGRVGEARSLTLDRFKGELVASAKRRTASAMVPQVTTPRGLSGSTVLFAPPAPPPQLAQRR